MVRGGAAVSLATLGGPLLAACGDDSTPKTGSGGGASTTATGATSAAVGLANAFVTFNPPLSPQLASITVIRHVFEPLMAYDGNRDEAVPQLLAAVPERTGPKTFSARLRPGATFHDGSPVTAEDVAFTFDYYKDPDVGSFFGTFLQTIEKIGGSGEELEITVTEELPSFHFCLSLPMIMPKAAFESAGAEGFGARPVGSGPYRFAASRPGQAVTLERYAEYEGPVEPKLEKIELSYLLEDASRVAQLSAGQLDIIDGVPYRDLATLASGKLATGATSGGRYALIETNQFTGPLADERVRQAFLHGLDREQLIERVFPGGNAQVANSQLPPEHPYYVEPRTTYPYDPERARSLLSAAGHPDGVEFELMVSTMPWVTELGTLIKEQLEQIGMRATIRLTETEAGYGIVATRRYDVYLAFSNWYAIGRDADVAYRGWNYGVGRDGFYGKVEGRDERYDRLVDEAFLMPDVEQQKQAYARAQELFSTSVMNNYAILWTKVTGAWKPTVQDYAPPADDIPYLVPVSL